MEGITRILRRFMATTILISIVLLIFNFFLLGTLIFKEINQHPAPEDVLKQVSQSLEPLDGSYQLDEESAKFLHVQQAWAMLIAETGHVLWEYQVPNEIPREYSLVDVAKLSRYYLMEYPVYIWEHEDSLLVVGYPKNSYAKYQFNLLTDWVRTLPLRLLFLLLLNVVLALVLSIVIGMRLIKGIRPLVEGIHDLAKEKTVQLDTKGIFRDVAKSINDVSVMLQQKTAALKARDEARSNWIAGISHDIRTPLSMVLGYASEMEENEDLPEEERQRAGIIRRQGEKLRSLVHDLNLVSMLEYEMQPLQLKHIRLAVLARQVATEFLNNGLDERYKIELKLMDEGIQIKGDESLLLRAITNLVQNSVQHNPQGCHIMLQTCLADNGLSYHFIVRDDGRGIPQEELQEITELPYSSKRKKPVQEGHGLGLPMVARIMQAHNGGLILESNGDQQGLTATMVFPVETGDKADIIDSKN